MSASDLSSRAIIGTFYNELETTARQLWPTRLGMKFNSNQSMESYKWLGAAPAMREFLDGRKGTGPRTSGVDIVNKVFEATEYVGVDDLRRDKSGQVLLRIKELAKRANLHWGSLLSALILAGDSTACYDGQNFFSASHAEGKSGTQSNLVTFDISDAGLTGVATTPTADIVQRAILAGVQQLMGLLDDQGEPMNEGASSFSVMVPVSYMAAATSAISLPALSAGATNVIPALANNSEGIKFNLITNPRLGAWTSSLAVFRDDAGTAPFILQEEQEANMDAIAEGSEMAIKERRHMYTVTAIRNAGYGFWQRACKVNLQA